MLAKAVSQCGRRASPWYLQVSGREVSWVTFSGYFLLKTPIPWEVPASTPHIACVEVGAEVVGTCC